MFGWNNRSLGSALAIALMLVAAARIGHGPFFRRRGKLPIEWDGDVPLSSLGWAKPGGLETVGGLSLPRKSPQLSEVEKAYFKRATDKEQATPGELLFYARRALGLGLGAATASPNVAGTLWLRSGSDPDRNDVRTFADHVLPSLCLSTGVRFVLITSDGDNLMPASMGAPPQIKRFLDSPCLVSWYAQNLNPSVVPRHPKLHGIPILFDIHTGREPQWRVSKDVWRAMLAARATVLPFDRRKEGVFVDHSVSKGTPERERAKGILREKPGIVMQNRKLPPAKLWELYGQYQFGISVRGRGLDCHRTWEMLFFGMIPVVRSGPLDFLYKDLPVVIVRDWDEIVESNFARWKTEVGPKLENAGIRSSRPQDTEGQFAMPRAFTAAFWIH